MLSSSAYSSGLILAGLATWLLTAYFMPDSGWRLGFGIALIAGILIVYLRAHVAETPWAVLGITYAPLNAYMVSLFPHQYRSKNQVTSVRSKHPFI